jgi:uncharacterized protein YktB (UPF0637 family)
MLMKKLMGFEQADFDLFSIDGLEERMMKLISQLRPKFYRFGEELADPLSHIVGEMMFPHVAKHARRKTNPPNDSWIALSSAKKSYKGLPHFQICVWGTHVLIQWGMIYEAKNKTIFSDQMSSNISEIRNKIPGDYHFFKDHMKPEGVALKDLTDGDLKAYAQRLKESKNGELMVGKVISRDQAIAMTLDEFYTTVIETWSNLNHLHNLAQ